MSVEPPVDTNVQHAQIRNILVLAKINLRDVPNRLWSTPTSMTAILMRFAVRKHWKSTTTYARLLVSSILQVFLSNLIVLCSSPFFLFCFLQLDVRATCSNSEYTTTTTAAPTTVTPSTEQKNSACTEAEKDLQIPKETLYFFTIYKEDTSCHTYLYCERTESTEWDTVYLSCHQPKPYFDSTTSLCVSTKPTGCS